MEAQSYTAEQRRAANQVWAAAGAYGFEPLFLARNTDGTIDFYMNCIVGLVHKYYGDDLIRSLFGLWDGDIREAELDDLTWLYLESAAYALELPRRPVLAELRRAHAAAFFAQEYQLSRQEWMSKNQLVYSLMAARWRSVLGQRAPLLAPWEKGLSEALCCPGSLTPEQLERAILSAFQKYLQFNGTPHAKKALRLHFSDRWAPLLTKLLPTEMVRTDDLAIGRTAASGQGGMVRAAGALRSTLRSNERESEDRDYIACCFGRSLFSARQLALIEPFSISQHALSRCEVKPGDRLFIVGRVLS